MSEVDPGIESAKPEPPIETPPGRQRRPRKPAAKAKDQFETPSVPQLMRQTTTYEPQEHDDDRKSRLRREEVSHYVGLAKDAATFILGMLTLFSINGIASYLCIYGTEKQQAYSSAVLTISATGFVGYFVGKHQAKL